MIYLLSKFTIYNIYFSKFRPDTETIVGTLGPLGPDFHAIKHFKPTPLPTPSHRHLYMILTNQYSNHIKSILLGHDKDDDWIHRAVDKGDLLRTLHE